MPEYTYDAVVYAREITQGFSSGEWDRFDRLSSYTVKSRRYGNVYYTQMDIIDFLLKDHHSNIDIVTNRIGYPNFWRNLTREEKVTLEEAVDILAYLQFGNYHRAKTIVKQYKALIRKARNMNPVNTKSLLSFIFTQMGALASKEITTNEAIAQAKLASQACNVLNYELKRTMVQMSLERMGKSIDSSLRPVESLEFSEAYSPCDETGLDRKE